MVETRGDVERVLNGSAIRLCLDTGHLLIGGTDPVQLALEVPNRIAHVHLKDVDASLAARVRTGELTYTQAVRDGMYTPLGAGDVDIVEIVTALRSQGFDGWFVSKTPSSRGNPWTRAPCVTSGRAWHSSPTCAAACRSERRADVLIGKPRNCAESSSPLRACRTPLAVKIGAQQNDTGGSA
jgi:hypothetical protein